MIRIFAIALVALALVGPRTGLAQSQTLADIRQELTVLNVEVQKLRREMSTTGGASASGILPRTPRFGRNSTRRAWI